MRRTALLVALLLIPPTVALAQTTTWVRQFGTSGYEEVWGSLVVDQTLYVSGLTDGELPGETSAGGADGFIRAYDLDGNELWTTQFGTPARDWAFSTATDGTGLYVTGITNGRFIGQTKLGDSDAFVAKFDTNGTVLWITQFGTDAYDLGSNVVADGSGVYVLGATAGVFPGQTNLGGNDVFHARLDADGNVDAVVEFGSPRNDFGFVNAIGPDGVYVNGYTNGRMGETRRGRYDAFVALFALDDSMTWLRQFGTPEYDAGYGLVADASGAYVTGETWGRLKGQTDRREGDGFARLLSAADGTTVWTRQFGTGGVDVPWGAALAGGELYAIGTTSGHFAGQVSAGEGDAFVQAMDAATGAKAWTHQFGTARSDTGYSGWVDAGAVYVVGWTRGAFEGFERLGSADASVARIDPP
jgi:hypothetical protein